MNKLIGLAVIPFVLLAGCATADKAANGGAVASGAQYYCWKSRLATEGDNLVCNWENSAAEACRSTYPTSVAKGTLSGAEPQPAGRCTNGEWLVAVTRK